MGPSSQQNQSYNALSNAAHFATNAGESGVAQGQNFMASILSGDPTRTAAVLSPAISAEKSQVQQDQATNSMFGSRSGGMAASNVAAQDRVHADTTNLIGQLQGNAANSLLSSGQNLLGQGMAGTSSVFNDATQLQRERAAKLNDIIASSAQVAGGLIGAMPANAGSWQDNVSNALAG